MDAVAEAAAEAEAGRRSKRNMLLTKQPISLSRLKRKQPERPKNTDLPRRQLRFKQPRGPRRIVLLKQHVRFPAVLRKGRSRG